MTPQEFTRHEFLLSNKKSKLNVDTIHAFLRRSHWAANRKRETVIKSIEHSLCYGIYHNQHQIAFARIVTDYCTYAYLCDVYVDEDYRGRGLSKWMMSCIMENPDLSELRRFTLATKDAHGLYEKFGFKSLSREEQRKFMSILKDNG
jgi:GNAT superfamily N-acetyltransferase